MNKGILVTGALGFLGSNLCTRLIELSHEVYGIDNEKFGSKSNIDTHSDTNWEFAKDDFNNVSSDFLTFFHTVIHCATVNLIYSQDRPMETVTNNAMNTIDFYNRFSGKIINISTASVYGNSLSIPSKEDDKINCSNPYDTSKRIVELYLHQRGNYTTIRPSNIFGKNQRPENPYCGVIGKMINSALKDEPIKINGDGFSTRDYTYVDDVIDAIVRAVDLPALNTEINVSGGCETDTLGLAKTICNLSGSTHKVCFIPNRSIDTISRRRLDITKAKTLLDWEPQTTLSQGILKTIEWQIREYGNCKYEGKV